MQVLGLIYSFAMPFLYLILAIYCWSAGWIDRINFLRQLRPPPPTAKTFECVFHYNLEPYPRP